MLPRQGWPRGALTELLLPADGVGELSVLAWHDGGDDRALRRLQVAADSGDCLGFALRDRRHAANPSPAALRLEAVRDDAGQAAWRVLKCRGGPAPAQAFVPGSEAVAGRPVAR